MKKVTSHRHFRKYILYCVQFIILGTIMMSLGPMIPYYSDRQGRSETQYASLMFFRAMGYASGSTTVKLIEGKASPHKILGLGTLIGGILLVMFNYTINYQMRCALIFVASIGASYMDIFTNVSAIQAFRGGKLQNWLQFLHGCFGIGGFLGPYLVYLFQYHTYAIIGLMSIVIGPIIYFTPTPEESNQIQQEKAFMLTLGRRSSQYSLFTHKKQDVFISEKCLRLLCISFLLIVGQQASYGSWISSYAVLRGFSSKQHANLYNSFYWISMTVFRFAFVLVEGEVKKIITFLLSVATAASLICLFIIFNINAQFGLISASLILGFANSALFALLLSFPNQYGLHTSPSDNSYFMLMAALGEGSISVGTGYLMGWFSYQMLFYTIFMMNVGTLCVHLLTAKQLQIQSSGLLKDKDRDSGIVEMSMI